MVGEEECVTPFAGGSLGQGCPGTSLPFWGASWGQALGTGLFCHLKSCSIKSGPEIRLRFSTQKILDL